MIAIDHSCQALWRALFRASRLVEERVRKSTEARGLCASDFGVLEALRERGPTPVNVLGDRLALTSGSITTAIDRLSRRRLVARRPSPDDARSKLVELLPSGRKLIDRAIGDHAQALGEALGKLSPRERKQALALLTKLASD